MEPDSANTPEHCEVFPAGSVALTQYRVAAFAIKGTVILNAEESAAVAEPVADVHRSSVNTVTVARGSAVPTSTGLMGLLDGEEGLDPVQFGI